MIGIVDVGGGLRAVYGAGILDYCLDKGISFPYCIGVSAGSANMGSYLAGQRGRNYQFYTKYALRKEYLSWRNYLRNGSYVDLDYVYSVLTNSDGENPLDYPALRDNPAQFKVVASDALTGKAAYFDKNDISQDNYDIFKASSALPMVCKPYYIKGIPYYDGGVTDPIPVEKAFADGCDKAVVILTRPLSYVRTPDRDKRACRSLLRKYPKTSAALAVHYKQYNDSIGDLKRYASEGKVLIIAPDHCCGMDTLTRDVEKIKCLYEKGYGDAAAIPEFLGLTKGETA